MVHNNCLDFADALCLALGVGKLPRSSGGHERDSDLRCSLKQLGLGFLFSFWSTPTCVACDSQSSFIEGSRQ